MGHIHNLATRLKMHYAPRYSTIEQIRAVAGNSTEMLVGHVAATIFVLSILHNTPQFLPAVPWAILMFLGAIPSMRMLKFLGDDAALLPVRDIAAKAVAVASLRGFLWFSGFISIMPMLDEHTAVLLEFMMFGLIIGGVISYWALPLAALTYSTFIFVGSVISIWSTHNVDNAMAPSIAMFGAYVFFNRMALTHAAILRSRYEALQNLKAEQEVVSLLLREFETDAKDWLWQTNQAGMLTRGMDGFAAAMPDDLGAFRQLPLVAALKLLTVSSRQSAEVSALGVRLAGETPFTSQEISIGENDMAVHLSLSAKPVFDAYGKKTGWHGVAANVSEARKAEENVRRMAMQDALTGLPNRVRLRQILEQVIHMADGKGRYVAYGDLDGFKNVNDTMGHAAGDAVLAALAGRFQSYLREGETVARIGGDEFVFVLERGHDEMEATARDLVRIAAEPTFVSGQPQFVGLSIGIVGMDGTPRHVDEILRRADLALYNAKQNGRGTARYYTHEMDEALAERKDMEMALRAAVSNQKFEMHYQPIMSCDKRQLRGYEALIRWHDPKRGAISPAVFIPMAEECGLIGEIGAWSLRQACKDARSFPQGVGVSINLSALQMRSRRVLADVTMALSESGLHPSRLELELTETALADTSGMAEGLVNDLRALGVQMALDDFGTGYSSLSYLHRFKFDRLKIDRSFVQAYETRETSRAVVDAIMAMTRQLGISVTAEGIETEEQFRLMAGMGCELAQGYLFGSAQSLAEITRDTNATAAVA